MDEVYASKTGCPSYPLLTLRRSLLLGTQTEANPEERLEKLTSLKEKGLITDEEYEQQRVAIISQI